MGYIPKSNSQQNPPDFIFKSQQPSPQPRFLNLFIFVLTKSLFQCLECLLLVEKSRKKYIEFSTKNKQLLINPQSKHFTIEPKIFTESQLNFFYSYNLTRNFV